MTPARRTPAIVLAIALALTAVATAVVAATGRQRDAARFANATATTRAAIEARLDTYVAMLHASSGLFAASGDVTAAEFRTFVRQFDLRARYPSMLGIGFARRTRPDEVDALVAARRADGAEDFRVWPDTARPELFPIVFLEPDDRGHARALGYDMFTEPVRRAAMARARDEGRPVLSGRVTLVQEGDTTGRQPGFLVYDPVYRGGGDPGDVAGRRARLAGFAYAPFRGDDLFAELFDGEPLVAYRVYDGLAADPERLLHASHPVGSIDDPVFRGTDTLSHFGRTWTIHYASLPAVEERAARLLAPAIALVGALVSLLLFRLTRAEARARARAERSEQVRSRFLAAMSHELRTPLNAIIGYNDLLLLGVYGGLPDAQRTGIERSQRAARHLHDLVTDVLDLSKLEADKVELETGPVHLPTLVEELFSTLEGYAAQRATPLRLRCAAPFPTIESDARRIRQIVLNLLSNAIKFGGGQPVEVRCAAAPDGGASIEVHDAGLGIPSEELERIFEEFVQLPNAVTGGTGLGLPISRRLAQRLGGRLRVASEPGRGSVFTLELPARVPDAG